uniref:Retrovirus-related Pol polyprotein LINE-1 n=1 Tax=Anthurium amnicola TaxID=1678845 RepID=A0A1D1YFE7_9ARAE
MDPRKQFFMKILTWNVRGLNGVGRRVALKNSLSQFDADIYVFVETKVKAHKAKRVCASILPDYDFIANYESCRDGRIWVLWRSSIVKIQIIDETEQYMHLMVDLGNSKCFILSAIYNSNLALDRLKTWQALKNISSSISIPWLVTGDFNQVRSNDEKIGGLKIPLSHLKPLNECIDFCTLQDMKSIGNPLSWCNQGVSRRRILARLDRSMINEEWITLFPSSLLHYGPAFMSDHSLMLISTVDDLPKEPKPFKFHCMWTSHPDFLNIIKEAWKSDSTGSPMFTFCQKLKSVKNALRSWNKYGFGDVLANISCAKKKLVQMQGQLQDDPLNPDLISNEKSVREEFSRAILAENSLARQKAKQFWLTQGDTNSKFFHAAIKARRMFNSIRKCRNAQGVILEDITQVKSYTLSFFQQLLNQDRIIDSNPHLEISKILVEEDRNLLNRRYSDDDIKAVVMKSPKMKSPGPDGFPAEFFQFCWDIVGKDFCSAIHNFLITGKLLKQVGTTFITLIPKDSCADSLDNFRPISLCNFVYKVISKLLANRLKKVLDKIISPHQMAFIEGRKIQDSILLANDLVKNIHSKSRGNVSALKADLRKAFDSVHRPFIYFMMQKMGFPLEFIDRIRACLEVARYSILFNGSPMGFFDSSNGIRQGDPLSPYLFVLVMEGFSVMMRDLCDRRKIQVPGLNGVSISHILFADDLIIFMKDDLGTAHAVADVIAQFGTYSGLHFNCGKSRVYIGAKVSCRRSLPDILGVSESSLPVRYLGLPLFSKSLKDVHCQGLVDKVRRKISSWKNRFLSKAGRLELIKSILSSYSLYWTSAFALPGSIINAIEGLLSRFFWSGGDMVKSLHMIAWKNICKPKTEGGLGIRGIGEWNRACLLVQLWDILHFRPSLWIDWVYASYLSKSSIWEKKRRVYDSWVWKHILDGRNILRQHIHYIIGDGSTFSFLYDPWLPSGQSVFELIGRDGIQVMGIPFSTRLGLFIQEGQWRLPVATPADFYTHGCAGLRRLWHFILSTQILGGEDCIRWKHNNGVWHVRHAWEVIRVVSPIVSWSSMVWTSPTIQKYSITLWQAAVGRLATEVYLQKRGFHLAGRCILCYHSEEHIDHLFFNCDFSKWIWMQVLKRLGIIRSPKASLILEMETVSSAFQVDGPAIFIARLALRASVWRIWQERCQRIFQSSSSSMVQLFLVILDDVRCRMESHPLKVQPRGRTKHIFRQFCIKPYVRS